MHKIGKISRNFLNRAPTAGDQVPLVRENWLSFMIKKATIWQVFAPSAHYSTWQNNLKFIYSKIWCKLGFFWAKTYFSSASTPPEILKTQFFLPYSLYPFPEKNPGARPESWRAWAFQFPILTLKVERKMTPKWCKFAISPPPAIAKRDLLIMTDKLED